MACSDCFQYIVNQDINQLVDGKYRVYKKDIIAVLKGALNVLRGINCSFGSDIDGDNFDFENIDSEFVRNVLKRAVPDFDDMKELFVEEIIGPYPSNYVPCEDIGLIKERATNYFENLFV